MTPQRPTNRAIANAEERAQALPGPATDPFSKRDLDDPVKRFSALCQMDEWANRLGCQITPDPETELSKLRPKLAKIQMGPSRPRPESGPLAEELAKIDAKILELGGDPGRPEPMNHDPQVAEVIARMSLNQSCSRVVFDGRPGQAETNARHRWFNDRRNLTAVADRLGYEVTA